jgi:uncharacterized protein YjiS (DUF1127 family)
MVTTEFIREPASAGEKLHHLATAAIARVAGLWRAARNRRSVARLLDWDDRMLRDIGLTAGDVRAVMALPASEDPSTRLGMLAGERRAAIRAQALERAVPEFRLKSRADDWRRPHRSSGAA